MSFFLLGDTEISDTSANYLEPKTKHALKWMEVWLFPSISYVIYLESSNINKPIYKWTRNQTNHPSVDANSQLGLFSLSREFHVCTRNAPVT